MTFLGAVVLILVALFVYSQLKRSNELQEQRAMQQIADSQKERIRNNINSYVGVGNSAYNFKLIGGISNLSLNVANNSGYMLDNVRVRLSYIKSDGSLWQDVFVDFAYVQANTTQTIKVADSERGTSIKYQIVSIKSTALGLN